MRDIDHIDPKWKKGRDYQLVCGLNTPLNYAERDKSENARKSNRFLPWRWSAADLGVAPVEPGDLCLFLDPDTEEWVLEEFMGEWWYKKTTPTSSHSVGGARSSRCGVGIHDRQSISNQEGWRRGGVNSQKRCVGLHNIGDPRVKEGRRQGGLITGKKNSAKLNVRKWVCLKTFYVSTSGPLSHYQKKRGIDPVHRVELSILTPSSLIWT